MKPNNLSATIPQIMPHTIRQATRWGRQFTSLAICLMLTALTACQPLSPEFPAAGPAAAGAAAPYTSTRLGEGYTIKVAFEADTNMTTIAKVQLDGTITLPLIGTVKAAGLTPEELRTDLMGRYKNLLSVNELSVTVMASSAMVYISGAVLKPGPIPMDRPLTALEAVMEAGGFDFRRAKIGSTTVTRMEDGKQRNYPVDLRRALEGQDPDPFYLKPFDIIHIPEKKFNL